MATRKESRMVGLSTFTTGRTLARREQPYLRMLLANVCDHRQALTIVVGAGVSKNAGLRSWKELFRHMVAQINDERLRELVMLDESDLMRKTDLVLQLIKKSDVRISDHEIIRNALYPKDLRIGTGQLALSIARLVAARKQKVRLLTTNFDTVLEEALARYFGEDQVRSFALDEFETWNDLADTGQMGVLHVHGVVQQQGGDPQWPIVVSESQLFKYGAEVRRAISTSLQESCSLFVGLSMTDPNLVGPVYEITNYEKDSQVKPSPRFTLVVPGEIPGVCDSEEEARYAIESAEFMERELHLRSVFLKSYSQLNQVLSDLSLAIVEPQRYRSRPTDGSKSLVYGNRLVRALNDYYTRIACGPHQQVPAGDAARELNSRLYKALHAQQGPVAVLRKFALTIGGCKLGGPDGENFALFLWLRCRRRHASNPAYALNLVGTSVFTHRDGWWLKSDVAITRHAKIPAAQTVFLGTPIAVNTGSPAGPPNWQGIVASPLVIKSPGSRCIINGTPADTLTIGAVTLNSTHKVDKRTAADGDNYELSVIARLDSDQLNQLIESVERAAEVVLQELAD